MMNDKLFMFKLKRYLSVRFSYTPQFGNRTLLSQAYRCDDAWAKRLESPLLRNIKMDEYFVEVDKKFNTKNLASGIDIDLFAINTQNAEQLDELEHLLYRFRRTKRAWEMMDSTICAVVRIFLKLKNYEALFRILRDTECYGIFPDLFSYNILLDTFIEEKMFKEAAQISILMMLQEDFSNEISSYLAVYSCYMFMKNESLDSLKPPPAEEAKDDDDEEVLFRVPFFRNPWFDDHFDLKEPRHLIGKTFFLAGRQMKNNLLSKTFQLIGLGMYEKWEATLELLNSIEQSEGPVLLSEGVEELKKYLDSVPNEDTKAQIEALLTKMQDGNKIQSGNLEDHLNLIISELPAFEKRDIKLQEELFNAWEQERQAALHKQNLLLDKQQRLEAIAKKKEYLFWKEKLLFFFENEEKHLEEFRKAQEITAQVKETKKEEEQYMPPEVPNQPTPRLTKYQRLSKVKSL